MKVSVIGAGAIGGWLAAGFARAGAEVSVLARGATLDALRSGGLVLTDDDGAQGYPVDATGDARDLRGADILLLAVKAHDLPRLAPRIEAALSPGTVVVAAINGLPWWFFADFGGPAKGLHLNACDPQGVLARTVPAFRTVGAVIHAASFVERPGHVRLVKADRVILGDAAGGAQAASVARSLAAGGVPAVEAEDIHREVWSKLWGNANMNPLSALTRADLTQLLDSDHVRGLAVAMMREMSDLGRRIGLEGFDDVEARIAATRKLGPFRTSMLQDLEAGRPLELAPIVGAIVELGRHLGVPTPMTDAVYGLTELLDRNSGRPQA